MIVRAQTLTLRETLLRDPKGLSNNKAEMTGVKNLIIFLLFVVFTVASVAVFFKTDSFELYIAISAYGCLVLYHLLELLVGTMYLERVGWVFLKDEDWEFSVNGQQSELGNEDSHLRTLISWADRQLIPKWEPPRPQHRDDHSVETFTGRLVDLSTGLCVMSPSAPISSSLCVLATETAAQCSVYWAKKVGMANFPTYIFAQKDKHSGLTIVVGSDSKASEVPAAVNAPPSGGDV